MKNVMLSYYKNQLDQLECDYNPDAIAAINLKYGKHPTETTTELVDCVYTLTGITRQQEATTISDSREFGNIILMARKWEYYNNECLRQWNSTFYYVSKNSGRRQCTLDHLPNKPKPPLDKEKLKDF